MAVSWCKLKLLVVKPIQFNSSCRNDAIVARLIADIGDFSVGLSNDFNVSGFRTSTNVSGGGFEVSLRYNMLASSLFESKREFR